MSALSAMVEGLSVRLDALRSDVDRHEGLVAGLDKRLRSVEVRLAAVAAGSSLIGSGVGAAIVHVLTTWGA